MSTRKLFFVIEVGSEVNVTFRKFSFSLAEISNQTRFYSITASKLHHSNYACRYWQVTLGVLGWLGLKVELQIQSVTSVSVTTVCQHRYHHPLH